MVSLVEYDGPVPKPDSYIGVCVRLRGLSLDAKPMDCGNGSGFYEMDTGDYYMFDEENTEWRKQ